MFQTIFFRKSHILCWTTSFQNSCRLRDNVEKYSRTIHDTNDNMAHAHCMACTYGYKINSHNKLYSFIIHCLNGYVNAPQYYISSIYIACLIILPNFGKNCVCVCVCVCACDMWRLPSWRANFLDCFIFLKSWCDFCKTRSFTGENILRCQSCRTRNIKL
jgi:hypothetical protein